MDKKPKRFVAPLLGLVAILVVVAIYMMVSMPSKDVDMPASDASPEEVVASYVDALNVHDCDTAVALAAESHQESTRRWCRSVAGLTKLQVGNPVVEPSAISQRSDLTSSATAADATDVVRVPVTFDVKWRLFRSDASMTEGTTDWGYVLMRESPTAPWRLVGEGNG